MIDIALLIIVGLVTWCVASEGPWGAGLTLLTVIFSGLLAMNFFEPLAGFLQLQYSPWGSRFDTIALVGLFALLVFLGRLATDRISPTNVPVLLWAYHPARWAFGFLAGYVTMAFLLTALHTTMFPRDFLGFTPDRKNLLGVVAPDRQWLAFTQHVSENLFPRGRRQLPLAQNVAIPVAHLFDGVPYPIPDKTEAVYLPTFIIRYASRRERAANPRLAPAQGMPAPAAAPAGGGGAPPAAL